jgi:hypothetical protein
MPRVALCLPAGALALSLCGCSAPREGGVCPTSVEASPGQAEAAIPPRAEIAVDPLDCVSCETWLVAPTGSTRASALVWGAGDGPTLPITAQLALGTGNSKLPFRMHAVVDGRHVAFDGVGAPSGLTGPTVWRGDGALDVSSLSPGSHQVAFIPTSATTRTTRPAWSSVIVKAASSRLPSVANEASAVVVPTGSGGWGIYPTDALLALGWKNVPTTGAVTRVSPIASSGATTFRLRVAPPDSNCPLEENRARIVAFYDGEPLRFHGVDDSFDVVVPADRAVEVPLSFDGLAVSGSHWIEFWAIWSPTRMPVDDLASAVLNTWANELGPQRVAVLIWNSSAP